jgi:hypothetical protein
MGALALLMQISLVLWPTATRWAQRANEKSDIDKYLAELSAANRRPNDPYGQPSKKFRELV